MTDSFSTRTTLQVGKQTYDYFSLQRLPHAQQVATLPYVLKVVLENLLRFEDGKRVKREDIEGLCQLAAGTQGQIEIAFSPARVLLQDFTGVPAIVDLAAMRAALADLGGNPDQINPLQPVELVIDHSVQVDKFGTSKALDANTLLEFQRNKERYQFLRWGQSALSNFKVVPPDTGIVHQVNLEYLARVVFVKDQDKGGLAYPDTLVGTDSHTTMINGLGILGWGVGGIEAEAAMLGQPISMLIPDVVGFKLEGQLAEGSTATDLVLMITQMLRQHGVVGKFVEFYGEGLNHLPLADRATIANMAPEYGATCGFFPVDEQTLAYMRQSGRSEQQVALTKAYCQAQGLFRESNSADPIYTETLALNMADVKPSIAGPKRPQDRIELSESKQAFLDAVAKETAKRTVAQTANQPLKDGAVVIAAITSCTNTSNPAVMLGAGLVAKKAYEHGLTVPDWVKTSLAPGSKVVTSYLEEAGLLTYLQHLGFYLVGYGCTTCIGNSGPLDKKVSEAIDQYDLHVCSVLSGNRNFEGRVHPEVRMNYLASPPLVVAYALAGKMDIDLYQEPIGTSRNGQAVYLKDIWPTQEEVQEVVARHVQANMFSKCYADVFSGDKHWKKISVPTGNLFKWDEASTYVKLPPFFTDLQAEPTPIQDIMGARVLVKVGDSITTDHISPAGAIKAESPAGQYLQNHGVARTEFNSYGSRRGNHEVMMRGTFANVRLRNEMAPGTEGGVTRYQPDDSQMSIYDAAMKYIEAETPTIVLAGKEYGSGSSRDWAAKGPKLLGIKAVIAVSFERIHRSNLVGMGILPLLFPEGESAESLGLSGREVYDISGLGDGSSKEVLVTATPRQGHAVIFKAKVRIDTPQEVEYYQHGGILSYVLRQLAKA